MMYSYASSLPYDYGAIAFIVTATALGLLQLFLSACRQGKILPAFIVGFCCVIALMFAMYCMAEVAFITGAASIHVVRLR